MQNRIKLQPKIKKVVVKLTNKCNLICKHCYVSSHPHGEHGLTVEKVKEVIKDSYDLFGSILFTLSGGEAIVRRKDALDILEYSKQFHKTVLYSNGTLFTKQLSKQLSGISPVIQISLDGSNRISHDFIRGKGMFNKTMAGINNLLEAGLPPSNIQIFTTIIDDTVEEINEVLCTAEKLGIERVRFEPVAKTGRALETWSSLPINEADKDTQKYRDYVASNAHWEESWKMEVRQDLNFNLLKVYSDGNVMPHAFYNDEDKALRSLGNIHDQKLEEILETTNFTNKVLSKFIRVCNGPSRSLKAIQFTKHNSLHRWDEI